MAELQRYKDAHEGMHEGVKIVASYMKECDNTSLNTLVRPSRREVYLRGLFTRALFWMSSLEKLDSPTDIQAVNTCTRALMELATDAILLHCDETDESVLKMLHWERSQKLHSAEGVITYCSKLGISISPDYDDLQHFITQNKAKVDKKRLALWPNAKQKPKHPQRWTGNASLLSDCLSADNCYGHQIQHDLSVSLEHFYENEYRRMNWYIHGSGLTGTRNLPIAMYYWVSSLSCDWCCRLSMLITKVILAEYSAKEHLSFIEKKWQDIDFARSKAYIDSVGTPLSEDKP